MTVRFEHLGREKGLTAEVITAVYQDRSGLLWVGSRDGLRVYDGHTFQVFQHDPDDPDSLSDNAIRVIYEDSRGNLWFGTNSGGLELLNRATMHFRHYRSKSGDPHSLSHDSVYAIVEDPAGGLWVGTQKGLNWLDPSQSTINRFAAKPGDPDSLQNGYIFGLLIDQAGDLWVTTVGGGLSHRDRKTGRFESFRSVSSNPATLNSDTTFAVTQDSSGVLWIGTDHGLARFDPATRTAVRRQAATVANNNGLTHPIVTSLAWSVDGKLLVGTLDGLNEFDPASGQFRSLPYDIPTAKVRDRRIMAVTVDHEGGIWLGTWGTGLLRGVTPSSNFDIIGAGTGALSFRDVTAILSDSHGRLWVGTVGGGLNMRPSAGTTFDRIPLKNINSKAVLSLLESSDGAVWVGMYDGLARINRTGATQVWRHDPADLNSLGSGYITSILEDKSHRLWVGTGGGGLSRLNADGKSFQHFRYDAKDTTTISDDYVSALKQTRDGALWVGTRSAGVNRCDPNTLKCERFVAGQSASSLGNHQVTSIDEDARGRTWIATAGGGLHLVQTGRGGNIEFRRFGESAGLPDNNITSFAEDEGTLWIGTRRGLSHLDPDSGSVVNYDPEDGLPASEFNANAAGSDHQNIYLGKPDGMVVIRRGAPILPHRPSAVSWTYMRTVERNRSQERLLEGDETLPINYGSIVSFEATVMDFRASPLHAYAYRLEGLTDEWIDIGARRSVTFGNLAPGMYTLSIRGRNAHGIWNSGRSIHLRVIPPFWMTLWFRLLMVASTVLLIYAFHKYRTAVLHRRNRVLLELKDERERALEQAHHNEEALQGAYLRLQALSRRIEAVSEDERRRIAYELHDELGQALTAAKINLQLLPLADADNRNKRVADAISLVDNMIERVRALSLDLRPPLLYELGLAPAVRAYLESQAQRSAVQFHTDVHELGRRLAADAEVSLFRTVQEAVTNIIRHANAKNGWVTLRRDGGCVEVLIRDDGKGFDVGTASNATNHLGLTGLQERALLLGGTTTIRSVVGEGTTVYVRVPLRTESQEETHAYSARG
jgi:ligand-binding sensor domain-containing protein/signal transduction histidine kinase